MQIELTVNFMIYEKGTIYTNDNNNNNVYAVS